jgi:hypothetical protein
LRGCVSLRGCVLKVSSLMSGLKDEPWERGAWGALKGENRLISSCLIYMKEGERAQRGAPLHHTIELIRVLRRGALKVSFKTEQLLDVMALCELKQLKVHEALDEEVAHEQTERSEGAREPYDERVGVDAQGAGGDEALKSRKALKGGVDAAQGSPQWALSA